MWRWPLGSRGDDLSQGDDVPLIIARTLQTHPRTGRFGTPLWQPGEGELAPAFVETLVETGRWSEALCRYKCAGMLRYGMKKYAEMHYIEV